MLGTPNWTSPFLEAVQCSIALREIDLQERDSLLDSLTSVIEKHIYRPLCQYFPSPATVEALLILALWSPIRQTSEKAHNGRFLLGTAITLARSFISGQVGKTTSEATNAEQRRRLVRDKVLVVVSLLMAPGSGRAYALMKACKSLGS